MELKLATFTVETVTPKFLIHGSFQPRGEFFTYLNDRRYLSFPLEEVEFMPMPSGYRVSVIKQESMNISWQMIMYIALLKEEFLESVQFLQSKRPVTFYTDAIAIRGNLHVNPDAHENDLIDETRDFLAITDAAVSPLRTQGVAPTRRVPLLALNRHHIIGYHVYRSRKA